MYMKTANSVLMVCKSLIFHFEPGLEDPESFILEKPFR